MWKDTMKELPTNPDVRVIALENDGEVYRLYYKNDKWIDLDGYEYLAVWAWMDFPDIDLNITGD